MSTARHSEAAFESVIEAHLLARGYGLVSREGFDRERAIFKCLESLDNHAEAGQPGVRADRAEQRAGCGCGGDSRTCRGAWRDPWALRRRPIDGRARARGRHQRATWCRVMHAWSMRGSMSGNECSISLICQSRLLGPEREARGERRPPVQPRTNE